MTIGEAPFIGDVLPFGGLTTDAELDAQLPDEFLGSDWCRIAHDIFAGEFDYDNISGWRFVDEDPGVIVKKMKLIYGLLGSFELRHERKLGVGGWMISSLVGGEMPESW